MCVCVSCVCVWGGGEEKVTLTIEGSATPAILVGKAIHGLDVCCKLLRHQSLSPWEIVIGHYHSCNNIHQYQYQNNRK